MTCYALGVTTTDTECLSGRIGYDSRVREDIVPRSLDSDSAEFGIVHARPTAGEKSSNEVCICKGHRYLTVMYQIDEGIRRLLWVGRERTEETLHGFFEMLGAERAKLIEFVASDMRKPYIDVVKERVGHARLLELLVSALGGLVSGQVVCAGNALALGANQEIRKHSPKSPRTSAQLVQGQKGDILRRCWRPKYQRETGSQKIKSYEVAEMALYHELERLPEPQFTHRFC